MKVEGLEDESQAVGPGPPALQDEVCPGKRVDVGGRWRGGRGRGR